MTTLFQRLRLKQQADRLKAEARLEKRRGYAKAGAERARLRKLTESGLSDLPTNVAVAIEELPAPAPAPEPVKIEASVEDLVARLELIKDRIFRLHAVFATSL